MPTDPDWPRLCLPTARTEDEIREHIGRLKVCVALAECGLPSTARTYPDYYARMTGVTDNPRVCDRLRAECLDWIDQCEREIQINAWHAAQEPVERPPLDPPAGPAPWPYIRETLAVRRWRAQAVSLPV